MRGATWDCGIESREDGISIHTPHAGSDAICEPMSWGPVDFNPHSPCGERLLCECGFMTNRNISIHTPHAGSDPEILQTLLTENHFNPHSPCGERRPMKNLRNEVVYFNPHSPCGERRKSFLFIGDDSLFQSTLPMRGATTLRMKKLTRLLFQSTLPMRGATLSQKPDCVIEEYFNPHSPCGERLVSCLGRSVLDNFNPHSPCGERRLFVGSMYGIIHFNPHSPCGERLDWLEMMRREKKYFNPHSPCGERQDCRGIEMGCQEYFNPHSPCGERRKPRKNLSRQRKFQSTLPMRGATRRYCKHCLRKIISIHTPHAGSDNLFVRNAELI